MKEYGESLPAYNDKAEAEHHLFEYRDRHLSLLEAAAKSSDGFTLDYSIDSLKDIERWYFDLFSRKTFESIGMSQEQFEKCMAIYFGETVVRNSRAEWIVEAYPFLPGKYEIGIRRGGFTMTLMGFIDHYKVPNNKRKQSLFRKYSKYFA